MVAILRRKQHRQRRTDKMTGCRPSCIFFKCPFRIPSFILVCVVVLVALFQIQSANDTLSLVVCRRKVRQLPAAESSQWSEKAHHNGENNNIIIKKKPSTLCGTDYYLVRGLRRVRILWQMPPPFLYFEMADCRGSTEFSLKIVFVWYNIVIRKYNILEESSIIRMSPIGDPFVGCITIYLQETDAVTM